MSPDHSQKADVILTDSNHGTSQLAEGSNVKTADYSPALMSKTENYSLKEAFTILTCKNKQSH